MALTDREAANIRANEAVGVAHQVMTRHMQANGGNAVMAFRRGLHETVPRLRRDLIASFAPLAVGGDDQLLDELIREVIRLGTAFIVSSNTTYQGPPHAAGVAFAASRAAMSFEMGLKQSFELSVHELAASRSGSGSAAPVHPSQSRATANADIAILTIRDDEFRAVLAVFPDKAGTHRAASRDYPLRYAEAGNGERYRIAVVRQVAQGTGEAQDAARDLIEDLSPRLVLIVGIAGGLLSHDVKLGDVVVSTRIHDFTVEARRFGHIPNYDVTGGPIDRGLQAVVANLAAREDELGNWTEDLPPSPAVEWTLDGQLYGPPEWQRELRVKLEHHYGAGAASRAPMYVAGPIASSDRLVKDPELVIPWLQNARSMLAIEMEAAGVYRAARERCPMLAIRGISDIVGLVRAELWTKYACASAAAFTRAFLRTRPIAVTTTLNIQAAGNAPPAPGHVGLAQNQVEALADLVARKVVSLVSLSPQAVFTEQEQEIARRASGSVDAIVKANAANVLGTPHEAREALKPVSHMPSDAYRYFTAMGDTFYFEQSFDEAVTWYERAWNVPGHVRDVPAITHLAAALQQSRQGDVGAHIRRAIHLCGEALTLVPASSPDWAQLQNLIGVAWNCLLTGDVGENIERAIRCYNEALTVYTREAHPAEWAALQNNLGFAWCKLPTGDPTENLQKAIRCCEEALTVYTREAQPVNWAGVQHNLGLAWTNLPTGDAHENLQRAIPYYEAALTVHTREAYPVSWAGTQNALGLAWSKLPTGDAGADLQRAIGYYLAALEVRTRELHPIDWAFTQHNVGVAWSNLPTGDPAENLQKAIEHYEAALTVRTREAHPVDWAWTQHNLGLAWSNLPTGEHAANLRKAIDYYEAALTVRTLEKYPVEWASTQNVLGLAWNNLPTGDQGENLERAIRHYGAALKVYTREQHPVEWAATQHNLGLAWSNLPTGERAANLRKAIDYYEAALTVRTLARYPVDWAWTQHNLGVAWIGLPTENPGEDIRQAIEHYQEALKVRTHEAHPMDWAWTQHNLGFAWISLPTGDTSANLKNAISCLNAALLVRVRETHPIEWGLTQSCLGVAWAKLPTGDLAKNLRTAIACFEAAASVCSRAADPEEWMMRQNNLMAARLRLGEIERSPR